ncbi:MAG: hypothetical protein K2I03_10500 [Lachnospiraceae bacterium]|nr:hypothetical protein [Lachnospiraceae bacterium]
MKIKYEIILVCGIIVCLFGGCGKEKDIINNQLQTQTNEQNTKTTDITEYDTSVTSKDDENTMYINGEGDYLKDYTTVDALMEDASAIVKVKILQSNSSNVRSYIYTSYEAEILNIIYGEAGNIGDILNVNMPGGKIEGEAAQDMLEEITEGKNAGDLSQINRIISDAGTDRLLQNGDEAYLFIKKESDKSYAAVGEYRGEFLLDDDMILFDEKIKGFSDEMILYSSEHSIPEEDFISAINEMKN